MKTVDGIAADSAAVVTDWGKRDPASCDTLGPPTLGTGPGMLLGSIKEGVSDPGKTRFGTMGIIPGMGVDVRTGGNTDLTFIGDILVPDKLGTTWKRWARFS